MTGCSLSAYLTSRQPVSPCAYAGTDEDRHKDHDNNSMSIYIFMFPHSFNSSIHQHTPLDTSDLSSRLNYYLVLPFP